MLTKDRDVPLVSDLALLTSVGLEIQRAESKREGAWERVRRERVSTMHILHGREHEPSGERGIKLKRFIKMDLTEASSTSLIYNK